MSTEAAALFVSVDARISGLERGLANAEKRLNQSRKRLDQGAGQMDARFRRMGADMAMRGAAVGILGVAGAIGYAVKKAADFESQMDALGAVTKANGREMGAFKQQALKAGAATKFSALDAARAQTELAKGGLATEEILSGGLNSALALAAAGEMELADAAETTVNAMKLFSIEGDKAMSVADALATAANSTTADVSDFGLALKMGGSASKIAGASFTETVAALEALAEVGIKGSDAGTSLKSFFLNIATPSDKAKKAMKDLGMNIFTTKGDLKSLPAVSENLRHAFGKLTKEEFLNKAGTIAGSDAIRALYALYAAGPEKLGRMERGLQKQGTAADIAAKKQDNLSGKLENLKGSLETAAITAGTEMLPGLTQGAEALTGEINKMVANGDLKQLGQDIGDGFTWMAKNIPGAVSTVKDAITTIGDVVSTVAPIIGKGFEALATIVRPQILLFLKLAEMAVEGVEALATAFNELPGPDIDTSGLDRAGDKFDEIQRLIKGGDTTKVVKFEAQTGDLIADMKNIDAMRLADKIQKILGSNKDAKTKVDAIKALKLPPKLQRILASNADALAKIRQVQAAVDALRSKTIAITTVRNIVENKSSGHRDSGGTLTKRPRLPKAARTSKDTGDSVGISTFAAGSGDMGVIPLAAKPAKKVEGLNPTNNKIEHHTPAEWRSIRNRHQQAQNRKKAKKKAISSTSLFDVNRAGSDVATAQAEATTTNPADDLAAIKARETLFKKRIAAIDKKLTGKKKLSREDKARLLVEKGGLVGDLTSLSARRQDLAPTFTAADHANAGVSVARTTAGLDDDMAAARNLVAVMQAEFAKAQATGDPLKIAQAADDLASASSSLDGVAQDMAAAAEAARQAAIQQEMDKLDAGVAMARLTETLTDDIAAQKALESSLSGQLAAAQAAGNMGEVARLANALADARESIEQLTEATTQATATAQQQLDLVTQQLEEERRGRAGDRASSNALVNGLVDIVNGRLGQRVVAGARTPTAGSTGSL